MPPRLDIPLAPIPAWGTLLRWIIRLLIGVERWLAAPQNRWARPAITILLCAFWVHQFIRSRSRELPGEDFTVPMHEVQFQSYPDENGGFRYYGNNRSSLSFDTRYEYQKDLYCEHRSLMCTRLYYDKARAEEVVVKQYGEPSGKTMWDGTQGDYPPLGLPDGTPTGHWLATVEWPREIGSFKVFTELVHGDGEVCPYGSYHTKMAPGNDLVPLYDAFIGLRSSRKGTAKDPGKRMSHSTSTPHMVMPYFPDGTLLEFAEKICKANSSRSVQGVDVIFRPKLMRLLLTLGGLHRANICHDDIQPDSVFVTQTLPRDREQNIKQHDKASKWSERNLPCSENDTVFLLGNISYSEFPDRSRILLKPRRPLQHGGWPDCKDNDVRNILKAYLAFLRAATQCGEESPEIALINRQAFTESFYSGSEPWSAFYWTYIMVRGPSSPISIAKDAPGIDNSPARYVLEVLSDQMRPSTLSSELGPLLGPKMSPVKPSDQSLARLSIWLSSLRPWILGWPLRGDWSGWPSKEQQEAEYLEWAVKSVELRTEPMSKLERWWQRVLWGGWEGEQFSQLPRTNTREDARQSSSGFDLSELGKLA